MFRLVKVLNGNNQCEITKLKFSSSAVIRRGCALTCSSGLALPVTSNVMPDYIALDSNMNKELKSVDAIYVTEDMIFKVEYAGNTEPYLNMAVGITTLNYKMDSVTPNSNGKGVVVGIDDDKKFVYVRFHR